MLVKNLSVDNWSGNRDLGESFQVVNWELIENSIKNLDGKVKTLVNLGTDNDAHMVVGGGENKLYIVYITFDNETFHNLIDISMSENLVELCVGGQYGEYPERMCVSLEKALLAAKHFAFEGKLETSLNWEE